MTTKSLTTPASVSAGIRKRVLASMGTIFKCSAAKAEERMQRPSPKYNPYRVAFFNLADDMITRLFENDAAGKSLVTITPGHWSAAEKDTMHAIGAGVGGSLVCYWVPGSAA